MWVVGSCFHKEIFAIRCCAIGLCDVERSIHFIRGDVVETLPFVAFGQTFPIVARSLEQRERAHHVGACKTEGIFDGTIHVTLCCQVDDAGDVVTLQESAHSGGIADIGFLKNIIWSFLHIFEVCQITGIGEEVKAYNFCLGIFVDKKTNYVVADETSTTGDEDIGHNGEML